MHVASLELCKELCELSGWVDCHDKYRSDGTLVSWGFSGWKSRECPAYDLGFLLRKLPYAELRNWRGIYTAWRNTPANFPPIEADTPEDCAAKLAIELFKTGVLTRE